MKNLRFNILFVTLLMPMCAVWGQGVYDEVLSTPESTEATKSITRAWGDNAQITYIENIEYAPFYPDVINSITAKFVYYDPTENVYKVAEFDNSLWPRVKDMEILEDTLYFCGYANITASSTSPQYIGYIGYFCIPQLFAGTGLIHTLTFNQQPGTPDSPIYWFINNPSKIEVFKVANGIHVICTGGWSTTRDSLFNGGNFIADVVHEFSSGDWWYSGNYSLTDPPLLLGSIKAVPYECVSVSEPIATHYHKGSIGDIINHVNNAPQFTHLRISPTADGDYNAAFSTVIQSVTIEVYTKEIICQQ